MKHLLATAFSLLATASSAATCFPAKSVMDGLKSKFGEAPVSQGIVSESAVMQMWANTATGTWTLVVFRSDGAACLLASGDNYTPLAVVDGDPA